MNAITLEEKALIVARHIPCDHCSCHGWRSSPLCAEQNEQLRYDKDEDNRRCDCGHGVLEHVDHWKDIDRRLQLALRIKDILKENGKDDVDNYTNGTIRILQRQILGNATTEGLPISVHSDDDPYPKRDRGIVDAGSDTKRQKTGICEHDEDKEPDRTNNLGINGNEDRDNRKSDYGNDNTNGNGQDDTNDPSKDIAISNPQHQQHQQRQLDASITHIPTNTTSSSPSVDSNTKGDLLNKRSAKTKDDDGPIKLLEEDHAIQDRKEPSAMIEERKGDIVTKIILNDGKPENLIYLTGLKNIFQKQLPMMPMEYIARLVYDRNHRCIVLIRPPLKVIGGICYRPFDEQDFAEIVFCAISSTEQVRGYGAHLMNHFKDYIVTHTTMRHFLTYADNYATGYFEKQGFTTDITLDRRKWVGFIKDYEGGTIMQCTVTPEINYLQAQNTLEVQQLNQVSTSHGVLSGLEMSMDDSIDPLSVPGVREPTRSSEMNLSNATKHPPHYTQMRQLVSELRNHASSWPFRKPVNVDEVADYYQVIRNPMDLATLEQNVEGYVYTTMDEFVADVQKIFDNCRTYNPEVTNYARCAAILEQYFYERVQVWSGSAN